MRDRLESHVIKYVPYLSSTPWLRETLGLLDLSNLGVSLLLSAGAKLIYDGLAG